MLSIKCILKNTLDRCSFKISLYSLDDVLLYENRTDIYGNLLINNLKEGLYKIRVFSIYNVYPKRTLYIVFNYNNKTSLVNFYFNLYNQNKNIPVISSLYDKNYEGLKIEGGKIFLWQNHTQ